MVKMLSFPGCYARAIASLMLVAALSACAAGLSKEECAAADWRAIGYEDGVRGQSEARIAQHRKACAKHGVTLGLDAYRSGWEEGVRRYCQPGNGYHEGRTGKHYGGVCPGDLEGAFLDAYRAGRELYSLEAEVRRIKRTLASRHARLDDIEVDMRDAGLELVAPGTPTERRVVLLDELRKLGDERAAVRAEIPALEAALASQQQRLAVSSAQQDY
ncbi:MAG: DUF2799 domain-containing protein [Thiogranum sp.]